MEPIQFVAIAIYVVFNLFFGVFFIIGVRALVKMAQFKKRKKNFTVPGKAKYVHRVKNKDRVSGIGYRYTYEIKVRNTIVEATIDSLPNPMLEMKCPMDNKWHGVMVNPENHSEFRMPSEDDVIENYKGMAIVCLGYGTICRVIFGLVIWGPLFEESGLR
jgi:hypothetical protein